MRIENRRINTLLLLLLVFSVSVLPSRAQVERVEPANWWTGMKRSTIQVLVKGPELGSYTAALSYPGVTLTGVQPAQSPNYLFLTLAISNAAKPGNLVVRLRKKGKPEQSFVFPLLKREQPAKAFKGFSTEDVICLITPDRFANGDITNDKINSLREKTIDRTAPGARHGGDIRGMIQRIDYLKTMGFTAVWPQPLLENDMDAYSYHGYAITDHYKVDPRYGTLDEYKELARELKRRGMKLIFDGVNNHIGSQHWWMKDLPFKDWINQHDSLVITTHQRTTALDPHAARKDRDLMTKGWFDRTMPDLNTAHPFVANYLIQHSIWWIETLQLGGIRQDTYGYSDKRFLASWSAALMEEYPAFNIVGEEWSTNPVMTSYWQRGKTNADGYKSCLPTVMDFPLQQALVQGLMEPETPWTNTGIQRLYESLANDYLYSDPSSVLIFGDNHDMDRLFTQLKKDTSLFKMALAFLLTTRGIPQLYYGTEVALENSAFPGNHGWIRADFPGGFEGDNVNAFTDAGLSPAQVSLQQYVKTLLNWRQQHAVIANGALTHFAPEKGTYVYFRYNGKEKIMVVLNKNKEDIQLPLARFSELLPEGSELVDGFTGTREKAGTSIQVKGRSTGIWIVNDPR